MIECFLCKRPLAPTTLPTVFLHDPADDCLVRVADHFGVSLDHDFEVRDDEIWYIGPDRDEPETEASSDDDGERFITLTPHYPIERALVDVFTERGLPRLGGQSTGTGWSFISLFQRCPYAWYRRYVAPIKISMFGIETEIVPLAIGSLVHTWLAVYYTRMIVHDYPLTPDSIHDWLIRKGCDSATVNEAWRVFIAYAIYYKHEDIQPLAVEHDLVDPRTRESCRFDLIAYFPKDRPGFLAGTYGVEHKTASRFDQNTLEGWAGDGEVLGQTMLWERLHLDKRFGPLRGMIVNIIGKQKEPQMHRTIVAPTALVLDQHKADLRHWSGLIQLSKSTGIFPRARNNCINKYGRCSLWDHCNMGE